MRYKIVSENINIIQKAQKSFSLLNMQEAIHIQEVDFWLIDAASLNSTNIPVYQNREAYASLLFIVNDHEEIKTCLNNNFKHYIKLDFTEDELVYWSQYFLNQKPLSSIELNSELLLDIKKAQIITSQKNIQLSQQEIALLLALKKDAYTPTQTIANELKVSSTTTVRTIINRIRKKIKTDIFEQTKGLGYKLKTYETLPNPSSSSQAEFKELEEQNRFLQSIIDSSTIFIATFIHQKLYCINKSFRDFLGTEIIKELWDEEHGDFFKLIVHQSEKIEELKTTLFSKGSHSVEMYNFSQEKNHHFEIETLYFENLDKHLLIFKPLL